MGAIGELLFQFLRAFLPFLFSGEKKVTMDRMKVAGLEDLDRNTIAGVSRSSLKASDLPVLGLALVLLSGCQLGGKETIYDVVICEPGTVLEIAEDRPMRVIAGKTADGKAIIAQKNIAGTVSMPKSVYREMRARAFPAVPATEAVPVDDAARLAPVK